MTIHSQRDTVEAIKNFKSEEQMTSKIKVFAANLQFRCTGCLCSSSEQKVCSFSDEYLRMYFPNLTLSRGAEEHTCRMHTVSQHCMER